MVYNAEKSIIKKPCTKVEYSVESQTLKTARPNQAKFLLKISTPPRVIVKDEYLIYDEIYMIVTVGGTISLCIGFSFDGFCDFLLTYFQRGIEKFLKRKTSPTFVKVKDQNIMPKKSLGSELEPVENWKDIVSDLQRRQTDTEAELKRLRQRKLNK